MKLTQKQRRQYNLVGIRSIHKIGELQHIGARLQYFYGRGDGTLVHHICTVMPYDSPSAGELVFVRPDNPASREFVIWDFELGYVPEERTAYYPVKEEKCLRKSNRKH